MAVAHNLTTPDFDCTLGEPDGENASTLTLTLKLALFMLDPQPGAGTVRDHARRRFPMLRWSEEELRLYALRLKSCAETFWNGRIYLLLPDPSHPSTALPEPDYAVFLHSDSMVRRKYPPFIRCALEIRAQAGEAGAHAVFPIAKLGRGHPVLGSYTRSNTGTAKGAGHHRTSPVVDHILGLQHVDRLAAASVNRNERVCYGGSPNPSQDVYAKGMAVDSDSAGPWIAAIRALTGHENGWKATHLSPPIEERLRAAIRAAGTG